MCSDSNTLFWGGVECEKDTLCTVCWILHVGLSLPSQGRVCIMEGYNPVDIRDTVLVELWTWINYEGIDLTIWRRRNYFSLQPGGQTWSILPHIKKSPAHISESKYNQWGNFLLFLNVNRYFSEICMRYNSNLPKVYSIWVVVGVQAIYIKAENLSMPLSEEPVVLKIINHFPKRPIHAPLSWKFYVSRQAMFLQSKCNNA